MCNPCKNRILRSILRSWLQQDSTAGETNQELSSLGLQLHQAELKSSTLFWGFMDSLEKTLHCWGEACSYVHLVQNSCEKSNFSLQVTGPGFADFLYIHIFVRAELPRDLLRVNSSLIDNYSCFPSSYRFFLERWGSAIHWCHHCFNKSTVTLSTGLKPISTAFPPHEDHLNYFFKSFHWFCEIPGQNPLGQKRKEKHLLFLSSFSLPGWWQ